MSGTWKRMQFGSIAFRSRYDCKGVIVVKLAEPSARALLKDKREGEFKAALVQQLTYWRNYGREARYEPTVSGTWV